MWWLELPATLVDLLEMEMRVDLLCHQQDDQAPVGLFYYYVDYQLREPPIAKSFDLPPMSAPEG